MADIKKMKSVGICTVKGIQMTTRKALCNIKGLSEAKVEKIKEAAGKMLVRCCDSRVVLQPVPRYPCGSKTELLEIIFFYITECWFPDRLRVQREEEAGVPHHNREPGV